MIATPFVAHAQTATVGQLLITEFRLRGPGGANDEFIEIYNSSVDHTVTASSGTGYAIVASDGVVRCTIPNGTVIPSLGYFLCVNSVGYSLASYPAGAGATATGNATYTLDIPDNAGIALFTRNTGVFLNGTPLDAVGSTAETNGNFKEGTGYPALTPFDINYSFYRDTCGKQGSITGPGICTSIKNSFGGHPIDTNNNATDFIFVDINGTSAGAGQRLGAPGPQNTTGPHFRNQDWPSFFVDANVSGASPPNRVRDLTSDPANNSTFGTLSIRRRWRGPLSFPVTRLRFRIVDLTTFPAPAGFADLRARTSVSVVVGGITDATTCATTGTPSIPPCSVTIHGTTLEQPPSQPNGGGFNSTLSAGTITLPTPLPPGSQINLQFLFGVQQTGSFRIYVNAESHLMDGR
jgi:hypothetical protein